MPERTVSDRGAIATRNAGTLIDARSGIDRGRAGDGRVLSSMPPQTGPSGQPPVIDYGKLYGQTAGAIGGPYVTNVAPVVSPSAPNGTFYGTGDPYLVLSDVFRNIFGNDGDSGRSNQVGQALVPVTSEGGGGSPLLLLLLIGAAAFAVYWFVIRKRMAS